MICHLFPFLQVAMAEKIMCSNKRRLDLLTSPGYLSSHMADHYSCGTLSSPWGIVVSPGQTLRIYLTQFFCKVR